ncbi:MAG: class I SAM-dependent methyltransferase [Proteobacteria bacterium]|nr:class I SAM-dependent methyltransferase [Pseudomonadota bacterium]
MPAPSPTRQPATAARDWFLAPAGRAVLASEEALVVQALGDRPGLPWLWCGPAAGEDLAGDYGRGVRLVPAEAGWAGQLACALPLPLPSESFGAVVLQHVARPAGAFGPALLEEASRLLVPGGRLWLFVLNPLAPYRWRWRGSGITTSEPLVWRRRLRAVGLVPDPVSQGLGPNWSVRVSAQPQQGPGLRAAYLLRAEKRSVPLTPVRRRALQLAPAA